jgi:hypothetical protein
MPRGRGSVVHRSFEYTYVPASSIWEECWYSTVMLNVEMRNPYYCSKNRESTKFGPAACVSTNFANIQQCTDSKRKPAAFTSYTTPERDPTLRPYSPAFLKSCCDEVAVLNWYPIKRFAGQYRLHHELRSRIILQLIVNREALAFPY